MRYILQYIRILGKKLQIKSKCFGWSLFHRVHKVKTTPFQKNDPYIVLLFFDKNVAINPPKIAKGTIIIKLFNREVTGRLYVNKPTITIDIIIDITG